MAEGMKESHIRFDQVAQEVIDMAPDSRVGYKLLAWHYSRLARSGKSPRENIRKSFELAQKVLSMDESNASAYSLLGSIYLVMRQYEKGLTQGRGLSNFSQMGLWHMGFWVIR